MRTDAPLSYHAIRELVEAEGLLDQAARRIGAVLGASAVRDAGWYSRIQSIQTEIQEAVSQLEGDVE